MELDVGSWLKSGDPKRCPLIKWSLHTTSYWINEFTAYSDTAVTLSATNSSQSISVDTSISQRFTINLRAESLGLVRNYKNVTFVICGNEKVKIRDDTPKYLEYRYQLYSGNNNT